MIPAVASGDVSRSGSARLRCWEIPGAEVRCPPTARPSRCNPRDRARLPHRLQKTAASQPPPGGQSAGQANGVNTGVQELKVQEERRPSGRALPEKTLDVAVAPCWEITADGPQSLALLTPKSGKDRYYGTLTSAQVEQEVRRLSTLLQGLVRDFSIVKDSVWHLEDERSLAHQRMDRFEQVEVPSLRSASGATEARLEALAGRVDGLDASAARAGETQAQVDQLACKLELMDSRLVAHEDGLHCRVELLDARLAAREAALDRLFGTPPPEAEAETSWCQENEPPLTSGDRGSQSTSACACGFDARLPSCDTSVTPNGSGGIFIQPSELVGLRNLMDSSLASLTCRMDLVDARLIAQEDRILGCSSCVTQDRSRPGSRSGRSSPEREAVIPETMPYDLNLCASAETGIIEDVPSQLAEGDAPVLPSSMLGRNISALAASVSSLSSRVLPGDGLRTPSVSSLMTQGADSADPASDQQEQRQQDVLEFRSLEPQD
mmetsp:Transcript_12335/g.34972  ORF Transcript_12335/g.34972 Transcript_12335/m.34972 type:complete len:493 (-) Transcript_12335:212-1690(-)